eukprot:7576129-Pyramimonas_sp.AAC.2
MQVSYGARGFAAGPFTVTRLVTSGPAVTRLVTSGSGGSHLLDRLREAAVGGARGLAAGPHQLRDLHRGAALVAGAEGESENRRLLQRVQRRRVHLATAVNTSLSGPR